jgi:hypothetical protein
MSLLVNGGIYKKELMHNFRTISQKQFETRFQAFMDWFEENDRGCNSACPAVPGFICDGLIYIPTKVHSWCQELAGMKVVHTGAYCPCTYYGGKEAAIIGVRKNLLKLKKERKLL